MDANDESLMDLAKELSIKLVDSCSSKFDFYLLKKGDVLFLQRGEIKICVDFLSGQAVHRREYGSGNGKNQPLSRAVGLNKRKELKVLDATAGLGGDAFILASLGCEMMLLERSPIVSALLGDGLRRGLLDKNIDHIIKKMTLLTIDAENYFSQITEKPDVIYLDPMYPHRKKSAKVKKEMQVLQDLLGQDEQVGHDEQDSFLTLALASASQRVVVKRPKGAEYLNDSAPTHSIESKKTRYDVYM